MPSATQKALELASRAAAKVSGQPITYAAGSIEIEIADAILGKTPTELQDAAGAVFRSQVIDWLILRDRMIDADDNPIEPSPGHRISMTADGVIRLFEVQTLDPEGCWEYSGPTNDRYRIHTREISTV